MRQACFHREKVLPCFVSLQLAKVVYRQVFIVGCCSRVDELVALLLALAALDTLAVHFLGHLLISLLFFLLGSLRPDSVNLALQK